MANNPFQTPTTSLWPLPPATMGTLFNTAGRVSRLASRFNSNPGNYSALYTAWNGSTTGFGYALRYLATGAAGLATSAYNAATAETFQAETDAQRLYCDSSPYVLAWCSGGANPLTSTQISALVTKIESNTASRETTLGTLNKFLLDGPGNGGGTGLTGYVFGQCAIQGLSGATDRRTNLRNLMQNYRDYLSETYADGWWASYDFITTPMIAMIAAYHIATGEESLIASRFPWLVNRPEVLARLLSWDGNHYVRGPSHNAYVNGSGQIFYVPPEEAQSLAVIADLLNQSGSNTAQAQLATWLKGQKFTNAAHGWTNNQLVSDSSWQAFLFSDDTITSQSPAQLGLTLSKAYTTTGVTEFRTGWNNGTDCVVQYMCGPAAQNDHNHLKISSLTVRVGSTWLIKDGTPYGGRLSNWEAASPMSATEVGGFTMCKSGISFVPSGSTTEDRSGSAVTSTPSGSTTVFPLSNSLTNGVRTTWIGGTTGSLLTNGNLSQVTGTIDNRAMTQITSATTQVGFLPGTAPACTIVLWDQFTLPGTVGNVRRNFFSFNKPTISGETVLQGTTTAGVLAATSDHVVIKNGSYQATIQVVSTLDTSPAISVIGGPGYENFYDGYGSTGGANMDFLSNSQNQDANRTAEVPWVGSLSSGVGQWRTGFRTTQALASEMITVITVGAAGSTAPTYTRASALALFNTNTVPGMTQYLSQALLNVVFNKGTYTTTTFYVAAFTTVGSDNGSGFVEPSGNGYARVATTAATWNTASAGSPSTITNASTITFPGATGSWGTIQGIGIYDASSGGNLLWYDYLGAFTWAPFTCSSASPGVLTTDAGSMPANADSIVVTSKYGGTLPTTAGSWGGLLTVANVSGNTFTAGVNTTGTGDGQFRKVTTAVVDGSHTPFTLPNGQVTWTLG